MGQSMKNGKSDKEMRQPTWRSRKGFIRCTRWRGCKIKKMLSSCAHITSISNFGFFYLSFFCLSGGNKLEIRG